MRFLYILICFFLSAHIASAQQPVSVHLTEKDGLPDIEFYDILEDDKGFIWLAADKGLFRYDGTNYKLFTNPLKRGRSLFRLTLDEKGRVWCNNLFGQFFYAEGEQLILFKDFENINTLVDFNIYNNYLIIKKAKEVVSINIENKEEVYKLSANTAAYLVDLNENKKGFYFTKNNILFFSDGVNLKNIHQVQTKPFTKNKERSSNKFFDFNNQIFFFNQLEKTRTNLLYRLTNNKLIPVKLSESIIDTMIEHTYIINDKIWVLTSNGVYITIIKDNSLIVLEHYFEGKYTTDILKDRNDNFWITTLKNGVFVIPNSSLKKIDIIDNPGITALEKTTDNQLYFASSNFDIFKYSENTNIQKKLNTNFKNSIYSISYNPFSEDLFLIAKTSATFYKKSKLNEKKTGIFATKSIQAIDKDRYLVSLPHALAIYSKTKDAITTLRPFRSYGSVLNTKTNNAYSNFIDGFGSVNLDTNSFKQIKHNGKVVLGSEIAISDDNTVWVATYTKGLYGFKNDTLKYVLNVENGLASNLINEITTDKESVWLATDKGLQNYKYKINEVNTISKEDGIDSYTISAIKVLENTIYFGSNTGLYKFDKKKILKKRNIPEPYFTNVSIQYKDTILQENYTLKQTESQIKISFNVNGFQSNEFVNYEYQLEGQSKNWLPVENKLNFVIFNNLPAGKFNFKLRAKNKFQNLYCNPIYIGLTVTLPFYKTGWFYASVLLLVIFFIWFYFDRKTKQLSIKQQQALEKAKMNQQLVFSQLENLRSQMNPHFIFNALNSIQDYIILNEKKLARIYLVKFSRLIRTYLEHSQKNEVPLDEEIQALKLYLELEKDRFDDDFNFTIHIDETLDLKSIYVPSLFIQPYVENALKHGLLHKKDNKKLQLNFIKSPEKNKLICTIIDNGVGRKVSAKIKSEQLQSYKSFATSANQKRIDLLNKSQHKKIELLIEDVLDKNQKVQGTKVIIKMNLTS